MANITLTNSIWPNGIQKDSEGYACFYPLGTNKTSIPTSSSQWPKGNKLVSPFVYQDDNLVGFCDTKAMEAGTATTIVMPYEHIEADFSSIDKGSLQIVAPKATVKKASWKNSGTEDIPEAQYKYKGCKSVDDVKAVDSNYQTTDIVNGAWTEILCDLVQGGDSSSRGCMFWNCSKLTTFSSDLSSMINGMDMFYGCSNLTTFSSDLSSLTNAYGMFMDCSALTSWNIDLPNLIDCANMFCGCSNLTTFSSDLPSLTSCNYMFHCCSNLTTFSSDLHSLITGFHMFKECYNFTSFSGDLSSLTDAKGMFSDCRLDIASVQNIADTIKDVSLVEDAEYCGSPNKTIDIGIGNTTPNKQEEAAFNKMASKGWTVYVNGSQYTPTSPAAITTLDENGEAVSTPIPFYAKPVQTDEKHAHYVDDEGNYFNILGAQFVYGDDISSYGMFTCEEDAAANMRLTPYVKPQTEIENQ